MVASSLALAVETCQIKMQSRFCQKKQQQQKKKKRLLHGWQMLASWQGTLATI